MILDLDVGPSLFFLIKLALCLKAVGFCIDTIIYLRDKKRYEN